MRTLWVDPEDQSFTPLAGDVDVDLAIVGAGFSGIGAAWTMRHSGASIAVLEERTVAGGASGRNAGFVLAGPAMPFDRAARVLGMGAAKEVWRFSDENNAAIARVVESEDLECDYLRRGSMSVAASEDEWRSMEECSQCLSEAGIAACLVERRHLPRPFDTKYRGGIYYSGNAEFNPGEFLRQLVRRLPDSVTLYERTQVSSLRREGERWRLEVPGGRVRASSVLLATNAYTSRILPQVPISLHRGQVLATSPLASVVVPFPMYGNRGYQYWRQEPGGRLIVGGWRDLDLDGEVGEEERLHPDIQAKLDRLCRWMVGSEPTVEYRWAGIMGFTPDQFPLVGAVPESAGLWIAAGYSGHGVALAFNCGAVAAQLALGQDAAIPACFGPERFLPAGS